MIKKKNFNSISNIKGILYCKIKVFKYLLCFKKCKQQNDKKNNNSKSSQTH